MKSIFTISSLLIFTLASAQSGLQRDVSQKLYNLNNKELTLGWAGGLNSVSISEVDLNQDGILDLFVYDKSGGRISTYINGGTPGQSDYKYAPEYVNLFPKTIETFVQFIDYNKDGKNDMFTYFVTGIKVFKNISTASEGLKFEEVPYIIPTKVLAADYSGTITNLYLGRGDIPAITDIDNDGDIDILAFGNLASTVAFYENLAADNGNLELLDFKHNTSCWGNFEEDFNSELIVLDVSCKGGGSPKDKGNKHAGSTLLAFDADGDLDKDLLVGDISSNHLNFLVNGGDTSYADMISQNNEFPPATEQINMNTFPVAHYLDVTNDGIKDLLVTPNTVGSVENANSVWLYKNHGSNDFPSFKLTMKNFLQNEMIDMGEGLFPAFFDHNQDGLPDLVLGNHGYYNETSLPISKLELYQGVDDGFSLLNTDLGGLSETILNVDLNAPTLSISPTFGDLDGDGDEDMIVGELEGKLHYFKNIAPEGKPAIFASVIIQMTDAAGEIIDIGGYATPQLFDIDRDGKLDLIIGERSGNLNYYRNTGTVKQFEFTLVTEKLGGVDVIPEFQFNGYSHPYFFLSNDSIKLLCGSQSGTIYYYDQIDNQLNADFRLVTKNFGGISEGLRSTVSGTDLNFDGQLDLVIGNYSGGVSLYRSEMNYTPAKINKAPTPEVSELDFDIIPVPSNGMIILRSDLVNFEEIAYDVTIYNVQGKKIYQRKNTLNKTFDLTPITTGVYYIKLENGDEAAISKIIIY